MLSFDKMKKTNEEIFLVVQNFICLFVFSFTLKILISLWNEEFKHNNKQISKYFFNLFKAKHYRFSF